MSDRPSLARQISALNAEIAERRVELERDVRAGRLSRSQADYTIESLEAIGDTLRELQKRSRMIRQRLFNDDQEPIGGCW
ncbi:MAG: hypothetical protein DI566_13305 [Microbacterium sp.]|nr:MAG: hypothetical protein DI566_13305 [Microbacterium sp.]